MTARKPGAVMGRPRELPTDWPEMSRMRIDPQVMATLDREAAAREIPRAELVRIILGRWARRQPRPQ